MASARGLLFSLHRLAAAAARHLESRSGLLAV